ncbi:hypothetical protein LCGC14_0357700 [marine sediment metagenome]|uniref:Uncharacterized protein n=1 Tax=marine sediment metagenome TaxID=412755 RepID=A0A0F9T8U3_9ZZZZ
MMAEQAARLITQTRERAQSRYAECETCEYRGPGHGMNCMECCPIETEAKRDGRKTELRPGIGYCDDCGEERWPQTYVGYGMMVCLDCLTPKEKESNLVVDPSPLTILSYGGKK